MAKFVGKRGAMKRMLLALGSVSLCASAPVLAQATAGETPASADSAASDSAMVNLVRALVGQGALKAEVGDQLIRQALAEAAQVRAARAATGGGELPPAQAGAIRVPYIPETVRAQIKDELRAEVMQQAKDGNWAAADQAAPEWTRRIRLHGDIRVRSQSELFARTNADDIIDYATINALSPYGIDDPSLLLPILNSRNDRWNTARIRARLGVEIDVAKGVSAGLAIATGDSDGPISTNSTLAGGFGKRDLWLDKAWIAVEPTPWMSARFGRFGNPFSSSDLLYDTDLNLDGVAVEFNSADMLGDGVKLALRGGAFPFDYGAPNAPTFAFAKPEAPHKYLLAGEVAATANISDIEVKLAAGYHAFNNMQGNLSAACLVETASFCSTDHLQPIFLTKGNTLSPLRQIVTLSPTAELPQLLGYTFKYRVLDLNASVSLPIGETSVASLSGSFVKNLGFDEADICRNGLAGRPYNNNGIGAGTFCDPANPATFVGGDTGYRVELMLGQRAPAKQGQWQAFAGYRHLESDAVLDGLSDSDFHLGGTNSKGYFVGGSYAVRDGLLIGGRWMSANEIAGSPLGIDVLQVDLQVKF